MGNDRGFSLIEAVFALAIVGVAAVAVLSALGTELRTAERAQRSHEAAALAEHRLGRLRLLSADELRPLADSLRRGQYAAPLEGYRWRASATPLRGEEDVIDLVVEVEWESGAYSLRSRVYRPQRVGGFP